jgi:glycosyltransferase involved in cell wall biosynthesis
MTPRDIVCVGFADWRTEVPTNQHHLMGRFAARGDRILFVESLGLRRPTLAGRDVRRMARRLVRGLAGPRRHGDVHVLAPLVLPAHGSRAARALNQQLLRALVARAVARLRLQRPVLWAYVPQALPLVDVLDPALVVYHCVDDIAAHPRIETGPFRATEARFAARADAILCTAAPLAERMRTLAPPERVHLLTNVADTGLFATTLEPGPVDPALARLPEPRLVFVGAISAVKLDLSLLAEVARRRPDWTLALVGPQGMGDPHTDVSAIAAAPNVHLLGPRPHEALPAVLRGAAAGLIPYRASALTASIFPMKVYEYLAAGLPVISTPLPALAGVEDIAVAGGAGPFAAAIEAALAADSTERRGARSQAARGHSWEARLAEIDSVLARTVPLADGRPRWGTLGARPDRQHG